MVWLALGIAFILIIGWAFLSQKSKQGTVNNSDSSTQSGQLMCVFCSGSPITRQHVWPKRFSEVIPIIGHSGARRKREISFFSNEKSFYEQKLVKHGHSSTHNPLTVCNKCNEGWIDKLEDDITTILAPSLEYKESRFNLKEQSIISQWAVMITILAEFEDVGSRAITDLHRKFFYEKRRLPVGWKVWMGKKSDKKLNYHYDHSFLYVFESDNSDSIPVGKNKYNAQYSTFAVGGVVILTAWNPLPKVDHYFEGNMGLKMRQIYPPIKSTVDTGQLDELSYRDVIDLHRYFIKKDMRFPKKY